LTLALLVGSVPASTAVLDFRLCGLMKSTGILGDAAPAHNRERAVGLLK
jgi:hypothetical protein